MGVFQKIVEEPTLFLRIFPALLATSLIPLLLIIQFDPASALFYPLALVSIISSLLLAYLVGLVIGGHRDQDRVR